MAKTVSITVPEDLFEKMQKWKGSFNYSKLCQDAISEAINKKEEYQKRISGGKKTMQQIVERLQKERQATEKEWRDQGVKDGIDWAKSAHYADLKSLVDEWGDISTDQLGHQRITLSEEMNEYSYDYAKLPHEYPGFDYQEWAAGFVEGALDFWNEVKDKL